MSRNTCKCHLGDWSTIHPYITVIDRVAAPSRVHYGRRHLPIRIATIDPRLVEDVLDPADIDGDKVRG